MSLLLQVGRALPLPSWPPSLLWSSLLLLLRPRPLKWFLLGLLGQVIQCPVRPCSLSPRSGGKTEPSEPIVLGRRACKPVLCFAGISIILTLPLLFLCATGCTFAFASGAIAQSDSLLPLAASSCTWVPLSSRTPFATVSHRRRKQSVRSGRWCPLP